MGRFQLRRALLRRLAVLALCLMTPGAFAQDDTFALDITFDHYFEGLTPDADGVYVVEPGVVLEYRVAIDLANTKISAGGETSARVSWWQGAIGVVAEATTDSTRANFFSVLPATGASDVELQQLLGAPGPGYENFRSLLWYQMNFWGMRRAAALLTTRWNFLELEVSDSTSATLVRPAGADARLEHANDDQLALFGILIPTNADATGAVEMTWTMKMSSMHWVYLTVSPLTGSPWNRQIVPNEIIAQPLRVRFTSRKAPEVRYFLADGGEPVNALEVPEGASASFYAGVFDKNTNEPLALEEEFSYRLTIAEPASSVVSFVDDGDGTMIDADTGALVLTFAAGVATTLTFTLEAVEDSDSVSETGSLQYAHASGATNVEHSTTMTVIAVDDDDASSDALALDITFDHYFKGLTPDADGVYVVEPGVVLEYRMVIDLANTKISAGGETSARVSWWQGAIGVVAEATTDSTRANFFSVLPATGASDVELQQLLGAPGPGYENFRFFSWYQMNFWGMRRAAALLTTRWNFLELEVSDSTSATLVRPAGADARLEHANDDQLALFGIFIPTNADATGAVEMTWTMKMSSMHWVYLTVSPLTGSPWNRQIVLNEIIAQPLRVRFTSRKAPEAPKAPEVRYFFADGGEPVNALEVPEGASASFYAGVFDKNTNEPLALEEEFSYRLTIAEPASSVVSFVDDGDDIDDVDGTMIDADTGALVLTFAAGVATTLTFTLEAVEDSDSVSETGSLQYAHASGATNVEHSTTMTVIAVDDDDASSDALALDITFDHYFEGLTPDADGVYVVEPGVVLEYRMVIDLANTKISAGGETSARVSWWQGAIGVVAEATTDSTRANFFSVLPATGASDVELQQLLGAPGPGYENFRFFSWYQMNFWGMRRAAALLTTRWNFLELEVSDSTSATLVRPAGADARLEHANDDQLALFGILIPTNADATGAVEMTWSMNTSSMHWMQLTVSPLTGSPWNRQIVLNEIIAQPLRVRFTSREPIPEPAESVSPD